MRLPRWVTLRRFDHRTQEPIPAPLHPPQPPPLLPLLPPHQLPPGAHTHHQERRRPDRPPVAAVNAQERRRPDRPPVGAVNSNEQPPLANILLRDRLPAL